MIKKIFLTLILGFLGINVSFAINSDQNGLMETIGKMNDSQKEQLMKMEIPDSSGFGMTTVGEAMENGKLNDGITGPSTQGAIDAANNILNGGGNSSSSSSCTGPDCLNSTSFMIDTKDFTPTGKTISKGNLTDTTNTLLTTIIQNLIVAIGVIALLVMSIGAGYMIFYHGQDEMLSKGKTMFTTGITALIIALTSYYLVSLVRYILYTGN